MSNKRLPVFKLVIDEDAEGMDFMGLVDYPAHGKTWITLSKLPKKVELKHHFNEEKRIVKGVAIATDLQIYRRDQDGFEYNIVFTKEDTLSIIKLFSKKGYFNNVNFMHDMGQKVEGIYLIEMFFINDSKTNIPEEFKGQNLQAGSVIFAYHAPSDDAWNAIKKVNGFSIEGWFKEVEVKFHKQKNQMKKSLLERMGFKTAAVKHVYDKTKKDKYAEATTVDGVKVTWEGDLKEGTAMFVVPEDGTDPMLADAGEYGIEVEGTIYVCTVDEAGLITAVVEGAELEETEETETEAVLEAMKKDYEAKIVVLETKLSEQKKAFDTQIEVVAKEVDEIREALEKLPRDTTKKVIQSSSKANWRELKKKSA